MIARSKKKILELFTKNGFIIIEEEIFQKLKIESSNKKDPIEIFSLGLILQKQSTHN